MRKLIGLTVAALLLVSVDGWAQNESIRYYPPGLSPGASLTGTQSYMSLIGSNVVTNGNLPAAMTGWTVSGTGTGWSAASGFLHASGNTETLTQAISVSLSQTYLLSVTMTGRTAGSCDVQLGALASTTLTNNATTTFSWLGNATESKNLTFTPTTGFDGKLTVVALYIYAGTSEIPSVFSILNTDGSAGIEMRPGGVGLASMFLGRNAGARNATGLYVTGVGEYALSKNTTGEKNTALGAHALYNNTTGYWNTAVGANALPVLTSGHDNVAIGTGALEVLTTGNYNLAMGTVALGLLTTGSNNTAMGWGALGKTTTVSNNTAMGTQALYNNVDGIGNTAIGQGAMITNVTADYNAALGMFALNNTVNDFNVGVGFGALYSNSSGTVNTAIGRRAGFEPGGVGANANTTGTYNTYLGADTGANSATQRTNTTTVGYGALSTADNQVSLGNASVTGLLFGGTAGLTGDVVVKGSDGNNCTLTFKGGIVTSETCP